MNKNKKENKKKLTITIIGGVGEFGKNMAILEVSNEMLMIDCGIKLLKNKYLGLEAEIADHSYIVSNKEKLKAILITHGHLDHIGGLPFIIEKLDVPIYAPRFACLLINDFFEEKHIKNISVNEIQKNKITKIGKFNIDPIVINHSIVDSFGYAIKTDCGTIVHSGDYRDDVKPYKDNRTDLKKLKKYGDSGVLALLSDSTNSDKKGKNISESIVFENLDKVIKENRKGRLIFATFSSQINRIQQILDLAIKYDCKVFLNGRSMLKNVKNAVKNYYQTDYEKVVKPIESLKKYDSKRAFIICTGTQGEENSALMRLVQHKHKNIKLEKEDVLVFSSSVIPGNYEEVADLMDAFILNGNKVITNKEEDIHSSGHGYADDLKHLLKIVKPKFFFPVHGRIASLFSHKKIAMEVGIKEKDIFVLKNGQRAELSQDKVRFLGNIKMKPVYIEGGIISTVSDDVLKQRQKIMTDGTAFLLLVFKENQLLSVACNFLGITTQVHQDHMSLRLEDEIKLRFERGEIDFREKSLKKTMKKIVVRSVKDLYNKVPEVIVRVVGI